ncbi:MAG TPA: FAD-binding oxidoreductase [Candidatus Babeliales bacterium]|nr:FAD-binding oxidoreductase [Candidatus Babeliales bacterium]
MMKQLIASKLLLLSLFCSVDSYAVITRLTVAPAQESPTQQLFDIQIPDTLYSPQTIEELQKLVKKAIAGQQKISIVGAGKSQGGQTISHQKDACRISFDNLQRLVQLDVPGKQVTVQAGMTWKQLQKLIAPHGLAIKAMQSYNDFSIGGSVSVNVHGQDLSTGQIISTVLSMHVILANGEMVTVSRQENQELFGAIIGGYGLIGIIACVTLQLTDDVLVELEADMVETALIDKNSFEESFNEYIRNDTAIEFYSARFSVGASDFMKKLFIVKYKKAADSTAVAPVYPLQPTAKSALLKWMMRAAGAWQRFKDYRFAIEKMVLTSPETISRNNFLNYSIMGLPQSNATAEYVLQEYFLPYNQVVSFIKHFTYATQEHAINLLNVTARHVRQDNESLLSFAPQDMCALVLFIKLPRTEIDRQVYLRWTRQVIDDIIQHQGTYYLPYHTLATRQQFEAVYPGWQKLLEIKQQYDPDALLSNRLYEWYTSC